MSATVQLIFAGIVLLAGYLFTYNRRRPEHNRRHNAIGMALLLAYVFVLVSQVGVLQQEAAQRQLGSLLSAAARADTVLVTDSAGGTVWRIADPQQLRRLTSAFAAGDERLAYRQGLVREEDLAQELCVLEYRSGGELLLTQRVVALDIRQEHRPQTDRYNYLLHYAADGRRLHLESPTPPLEEMDGKCYTLRVDNVTGVYLRPDMALLGELLGECAGPVCNNPAYHSFAPMISTVIEWWGR